MLAGVEEQIKVIVAVILAPLMVLRTLVLAAQALLAQVALV